MGLLEELAVRCEAAMGADRELDAWIETTLLADITKLTVFNTPAKWVDAATRLHWNVNRYTATIDVAMRLIPSGVRLTFSEWDDEKHLRPRGPWQAILTKAGSGSSFNDMLGYRCDHAATPALAVCASALRARHALALSKGSDT